MIRGWRVAALGSLAIGTVACSAILGLDPPEQDSPDGGTTPHADGSVSGDDGGLSDASDAMGPTLPEDAGSLTCAPVNLTVDLPLDGGGSQTITYQPFVQEPGPDGGAAWQFFDTTSIDKQKNPSSLSGGTFDGRYVYFPSRSTQVFRYDTQNGIGFTAGWEEFNTNSIAPGAADAGDAGDGGGTTGGGASDAGGSYTGGFSGAVSDGTYVYFIPEYTTVAGARVPQRTIVRFDPRVAGTNLKTAAAYTFFDLGTIANAGSLDSGFFGATFDGRYLYLVPSNNGQPDGRVLRYDAVGGSGIAGGPDGFTLPTSWSAFDLTAAFTAGGVGTAAGFAGAVFDGTSVFFVPQYNDAFDGGLHGGSSSFTARLNNVNSAFTDAGSWTVFDLTLVSGNAYDYLGGAYDGVRYVYYAPRSGGPALRFDTKMPTIATASAWSYYDLQRLVPPDAGSVGYAGAAFDGRFVTFLPAGVGFGTIIRYDTASSFGADCAWSALDLTTVPSGLDAGNFDNAAGAVFDGQYLYVVPASTGVVARFLVRSSPEPLALPPLPAFHGSFL